VLRRTFHWAVVAALAGGAGCGETGSVTLRFDVPEDTALQPAGAASLTLIARVGEETPRATTASIGDGAAIDLGDLPVEDDIWLAAELRTGQDHLVGYGEASGPISVSATDVTEATIPVRRPFVYLAGSGSRLISLDASLAATTTYRGSVPTKGASSVIADVAGVQVATITSAGGLSYLSTSTHTASDLDDVQLDGNPRDAVATPDGAFLVVAHGTAGTVSVVTVATGEVKTGTGGAPADRVAVTRGSDGNWWGVALVNRATTDTQCGMSSLAAFPLDAPDSATMMNAGLGLADVGGDIRTGIVLIADRCGDRVLRFDPVTGGLDVNAPVMTLPSPTVVAASDRRVWAIGHDILLPTPQQTVPDGIVDAWLILGSADLETGDATVEALPVVVERVLASTLDYPDQDITQDLHANSAMATDLIVMPGGEQLAFTMSARMQGDAFVDEIFGDTVLPSLDMTTQEYWLIDATTRATSQRVRTSCVVVVGSCDSRCIAPEWECLPDVDDAMAGIFAPTGMAALFGAR
jgi:hypothetical protein